MRVINQPRHKPQSRASVLQFAAIALALSSALLLSGNLMAETKSEMKAEKPKGMPVSAITIEPKRIQLWKSFSGNVEAVDKVNIRPQVSGLIKDIKFQDGDEVEKGDVLMVIDPRPYKAALQQAKAALDTAKTRAEFAKNELDRAKSLVNRRAVAERTLDQRNHEYKTALAEIMNAEAMVETASINLDYAFIKAPIAGKVSRAEITEGNLVQSGSSAPVLTRIVANDAVYIDFEIDEQTYLISMHKAARNGLKNIPIKITLDQPTIDSGFTLKGHIHSIDNQMNPATGTIRARGLFKNPNSNLLPGMTVSVKLGLADSLEKEQIIISERAIGTDQDRKFVYTVNQENKATYREVTIGQSLEGKRVILSGLKKGDVVITEGLMRIRPGALVDPQIKKKQETSDKQSSALN